MSVIKLDEDVLELLRDKKKKDFINMKKWASNVLRLKLNEDKN